MFVSVRVLAVKKMFVCLAIFFLLDLPLQAKAFPLTKQIPCRSSKFIRAGKDSSGGCNVKLAHNQAVSLAASPG